MLGFDAILKFWFIVFQKHFDGLSNNLERQTSLVSWFLTTTLVMRIISTKSAVLSSKKFLKLETTWKLVLEIFLSVNSLCAYVKLNLFLASMKAENELLHSPDFKSESSSHFKPVWKEDFPIFLKTLLDKTSSYFNQNPVRSFLLEKNILERTFRSPSVTTTKDA